MSNTIQPVDKRILVQPKAIEERTKSGLILTQTNKPRNRGIVINVGSKVEEVTIGEDIMFLAVLTVVEGPNGEEFFLVNEEDVAAIFR